MFGLNESFYCSLSIMFPPNYCASPFTPTPTPHSLLRLVGSSLYKLLFTLSKPPPSPPPQRHPPPFKASSLVLHLLFLLDKSWNTQTTPRNTTRTTGVIIKHWWHFVGITGQREAEAITSFTFSHLSEFIQSDSSKPTSQSLKKRRTNCYKCKIYFVFVFFI